MTCIGSGTIRRATSRRQALNSANSVRPRRSYRSRIVNKRSRSTGSGMFRGVTTYGCGQRRIGLWISPMPPCCTKVSA